MCNTKRIRKCECTPFGPETTSELIAQLFVRNTKSNYERNEHEKWCKNRPKTRMKTKIVRKCERKTIPIVLQISVPIVSIYRFVGWRSWGAFALFVMPGRYISSFFSSLCSSSTVRQQAKCIRSHRVPDNHCSQDTTNVDQKRIITHIHTMCTQCTNVLQMRKKAS